MRQTFEVVRSASETVATPGIPTPLPGLVITDDGHGEGVELVHVRSGLPIFGAKSAETIAKVIPLLAPYCEIAAERCGGPMRHVDDGFDWGAA